MMNQDSPLTQALRLPSGARFYRCALQVNPFEYTRKYQKGSPFKDEDSYNAAIIEACLKNGVEVIAITDHYCVQTAEKLSLAAHAAGLHVFPGFEAVTKDGAHLLCLFDQDQKLAYLERVLGDCGIHDYDSKSPQQSKYDLTALLDRSPELRFICIAAHAASKGGLFQALSGQSRVAAWQCPTLLAISIPGPVKEAPNEIRPILENKDSNYRRDRLPAIINAQDVSHPDDLAKPGASTWIKMSEVTVEGLRQAFLDPASRVRLSTDPAREDHTEFISMAWQGGFLDGSAIHFNENLNVLIGGRGTGKSTVIESIRYVLGLEPLGAEATSIHDGIVQNVLRSGTKISLLIRSHRPSTHEFTVERTIPNPPVVRDQSGAVLKFAPKDVVPKVEVYGQHEISELTTEGRARLTHLLDRFIEPAESLTPRKNELKRALEKSRLRILEIHKEQQQVEERLAALPGLEETLNRFREAGLEERLKDQSLIVREESVLTTATERVAPLRELAEQLRRNLPLDRAFLSAKALEELPGKQIIGESNTILERLDREINSLSSKMTESIETAEKDLSRVHLKWEERKQSVQAQYEKILRDLQRSKIDGEEFIRLRRQIEALRPLKERQAALQRTEKDLSHQRRNLLAEWEDIKTEEFRRLERAAKKVGQSLQKLVRVQVEFGAIREPLFALLRDKVGGRLSEAIDTLKRRPSLSVAEFAEACWAGRDTLAQKFGLSFAQAERIAKTERAILMEIEELELPPRTQLELNVAAEDQSPVWQTLDQLSTGQKATAVLLLLLLESEAPLVIDQPEDDLDNRFITDGVVPLMRTEKRRRQFVFATHNANIPVLGDAELILGLTASGEAGQGKALLPSEYMASIDSTKVRELVEEVLEGGKDAFEMRRLKYGF